MAISSIGAKTAYTTGAATRAVDRRAADSAAADSAAAKAAGAGSASVADHVAAQDEQEPIRSVSTTQGTLVDTYL
jgi:hypothetical protein